MQTNDRMKKIDEIFELVTTALKKELTRDEVSDKILVAALRFLNDYEVERLPEPGSAVPDAGPLPFPKNGTTD